MIACVDSFILQGIDAMLCELEVDLSPVGMPKTTIVGLPDVAVKESAERVRTAIINSGYRFPQSRITINLAPANVRKEGAVYDLPIAMALLMTNQTIAAFDEDAPRVEDLLVAGELALDGRVRPVNGIVSFAMLASDLGKRGVIVPKDNAAEAAVVDGIRVYPVTSLGEVVAFLNARKKIDPFPPIDVSECIDNTPPRVDFGDIRGQEAAKRAMTIAAAGAHNVLMVGPAGTGKTMMAKAIPGVLPPLTTQEALEVTRIYSSVGKISRGQSLIVERPVRTPHHTASSPAVVGGGTVPRPGDVSLAHRGVLFLDELPEFSRGVLETLREPLEDGEITIARAHGSVRFPARFMLIAAMNPSPKGNFGKDEISRRAMDKYLSRISGPLIDRIDIHVEVPNVPFRKLTGKERGTDTATIRQRVIASRDRQYARNGKGIVNAYLAGKLLDRHASLDDTAKLILEQAMRELNLSARAYDKIRRVARTIADLEDSESVQASHIAEAVQYRLLDRLQH